MKGRQTAFLLAFSLLLAGFSSIGHAQTIKLATIAPEGSGWMNDMRSGAREISERTDGRVKIKIYGGGVQGNDKQVVRKMRIGQLHGGAFTSNTLSDFQKNTVLYAMPMVFNNLEEVRYVRDKMDGKLREMLEDAGYVNFGFAGGGFARIMSIRSIANLDDLKNLKVWVPEGDRISYEAARTLGISPVSMPLTDVMTGLQTELIDTVMSPPAATIVLQWNTKVNYITELPLSYIFAMMVIEQKYFNRIKAEDQPIVREVMEGIYRGFDEQGNQDNIEAYQALLADGMQAVTPDQGQIPEWHRVIRQTNHRMADEGIVDIELLNELECHVTAYRESDPGRDC
jgi:TRAP-type C4-dicarboxylate transport system substrate-binding protein